MADDGEIWQQIKRTGQREDAQLSRALSLSNSSLIDASSAEKWEALVKLACCSTQIRAVIERESRKIQQWAERERRKANRREKAIPCFVATKARGRPLAKAPKDTAQQLKALARAFEEVNTSGYPGTKLAIRDFLRKLPEKFRWLRVMGNG